MSFLMSTSRYHAGPLSFLRLLLTTE